MKTIERIKQLSDNEILSVYQGFSGFLLKKTNVDPEEVIKNIPQELKEDNELDALSGKEIDDLDTSVNPHEVIPLVKVQLVFWAENPEIAPLLDEYLDTNKIQPMAAGAILLVGAVLITTIISTSLKIERKDGKTIFSYDSNNISDNAVKLVNAILTAIPESLKSILIPKS